MAKLAAIYPCESRARSIKEFQAPAQADGYDLLIELHSVLHERLEKR